MLRKQNKKRANGDGSIVYEPDRKKYRAFIVDPAGKRISKRFDTKTAASTWLAETRTDILRQDYVPASDITLGDWIISFLETYKKNQIRETSYFTTIQIAQRLTDIADYPLQSITTHQIQQHLNNLHLSPKYTREIARVLKEVFSKAVKLGMLKHNPMDEVSLPKMSKIHFNVLTKEQISTIITKLDTDRRLNRYSALFKLLIYSGCRIGEALALNISNVSDSGIRVARTLAYINGQFYYNEPKTSSSLRTISLPTDIVQELRNHYTDNENQLVFHTASGMPYTPAFIRKKWNDVLNACGITETFSLHSIRHTHATLLIHENVPITEISRRLGHASVSITLNYYAEFVQGYDNKIADKLTNLFVAPTLHPLGEKTIN